MSDWTPQNIQQSPREPMKTSEEQLKVQIQLQRDIIESTRRVSRMYCECTREAPNLRRLRGLVLACQDGRTEGKTAVIETNTQTLSRSDSTVYCKASGNSSEMPLQNFRA
ncbi:hypothetical protein ACN38_g8334 [Penicillium nordicum]|uniref:Uncharacterized protein n=1 Tax=Penicillium nordicum TaxID=229535 RepID=A0A0M9WDK4_9EURO|nr:hypothetical protein ACN38_g8334 [Penicillium nordicum]